MSNEVSKKFVEGILSRYMKPSFVNNEYFIDTVGFDLRERTPPERYVSFYKVEKENDEENYISAISCLKITPKNNGAIILLDVAESLIEVNDEDEDIIHFIEAGLPHCGMSYLTNDLTKIQEAKTTLSFLALNKRKYIRDIDTNYLSN